MPSTGKPGMKSDNYNLLEEKWIPVLHSNGKFDHVGIYERDLNN
jgi:hypothetical protein